RRTCRNVARLFRGVRGIVLSNGELGVNREEEWLRGLRNSACRCRITCGERGCSRGAAPFGPLIRQRRNKSVPANTCWVVVALLSGEQGSWWLCRSTD